MRVGTVPCHYGCHKVNHILSLNNRVVAAFVVYSKLIKIITIVKTTEQLINETLIGTILLVLEIN